MTRSPDITVASMITDAHTHNPCAADAVISLEPGGEIEPGRYYSVGIHPWSVGKDRDYGRLEEMIARKEVVAVGETGFDPSGEASRELQKEVFGIHARLAEKYGKPLIIHVVRRYDDLIAMKRLIKPSVPWIIHGWRGNPQLTEQLLREGFMFSVGEKFNPASLEVIPAASLLIETDQSALPIEAIAEGAGVPVRDFSPLFVH